MVKLELTPLELAVLNQTIKNLLPKMKKEEKRTKGIPSNFEKIIRKSIAALEKIEEKTDRLIEEVKE